MGCKSHQKITSGNDANNGAGLFNRYSPYGPATGEQLERLGDEDPVLAADIAAFRAEELEHQATARAHGAADAFGFPVMSTIIRAGCRVAIGLSKRI